MRLKLGFAILASAAIASACAGSVRVTSQPAGGRILIDGKDTGRMTPDTFRARVLPSGRHEVTVDLAGYAKPPPVAVETSVSVGIIFWSVVFPPALLVNAFRGFSRVKPDVLHFNLTAASGSTAGPVASGLPAETQVHTPPPGSIQGYAGQHKQLATPGTKCAALPLQGSDVTMAMVSVMDEILLSELQQSGFEPIGRDDLNALLSFDAQRSAMSCDDATCIAEIGKALGVPFLVAGKVARIGDNSVVTLKLIDVQASRVRARSHQMSVGADEVIPRLLGQAVQEVVVQSGL